MPATRPATSRTSPQATGATAALPKLIAVRHRDGSGITHIEYEHRPDECTAIHSWAFYRSYLSFTDALRFAVHAPPDDSPAAAAAGMTILMYHFMHERTGMLFCRPGDAAWTKVEKPNRFGFGYFDFVYHDGRMFGMDTNGKMAVYDAATLDVLHLVGAPPVPSELVTKMYGITTMMDDVVVNLEDYDYVNLVPLPSKLILVMTTVKSSLPVAFSIFELGSTPGGLAWHKVINAGNYELFLDRYHNSFRENTDNGGTRIYYVHDDITSIVPSTTSVYYYSMQDSKLECVHRLVDDAEVYSTKPCWFVP
ncbi:hypothetical protein HU200_006598 [Digitaria exilis]|uniref:KIB1-4 beta-propeller domain-containing protein n=1 Tax=Digitaria exilis TaxID=1010633 RepID=A0A835BUG4_9POAL|nr:hypothetical protein HU200_032415 [Digitaria exilis]KAF8769391.1 hypothetical protein HU200_006598 [Digitaria exilis]